MTDPTTTITYVTCKREVAYFLGFDPPSLSSAQVARVDAVIQQAYHQYLYPPAILIPGHRVAMQHQWTWLTPLTTIDTSTSDNDIDLPDDFGGIRGDMTVSSSDNLYRPIQSRGEGFIRRLRSTSDQDGRPVYFAIRVKAATKTAAQKWEVMIWPDPDAVYKLQYRYVAIPAALSTTDLHPMGGATHGDLLLASCKEVADRIENDNRGNHYAVWMEKVMSHVMMDRQNIGATNLGYNRDNSDASDMRIYATHDIEVNGVVPT